MGPRSFRQHDPSFVYEEAVKKLQERLEAIHGSGILRRESKGLHLYLASPANLELAGLDELKQRL